MSLAALTKIILALLISVSALVVNDSWKLCSMLAVEGIVLVISGSISKIGKTTLALVVFAVGLYAVQLLCGSSQEVAVGSALKMLIMSLSILQMLAVTNTQQIMAALVKQCHMPYAYAFMITAVLRFVPDVFSESKAVREAQVCRGFQPSGNPLRRLADYMMIIKPMVFRAITRSENMAVSLEMRGFTQQGKRTFMAETKLRGIDYSSLLVSAVVLVGLVKY